MPKTVAITCTSPRCHEITTDLRHQNIDAHACPILSVKRTNNELPDGHYDVALTTSIHAISPSLPRNLPYVAVGDYTAQQLRKMGFQVIETGNGGVRDLDTNAYENILYPCAVNPTYVPANARQWPVYDTVVNSDFQWVCDFDCIAIFSMRAAHAIRPHVPQNMHLICLSASIASVFKDHPIGNLAVSPNPHYDDMKLLIQSTTRTDNKKDL